MELSDAWSTYSFDSAQAARYLGELMRLLADRGVDITDRRQLKQGFEGLFNITYHNIPSLDERGYILAPNHVSDFDALILGLLHENIKILAKSGWTDSPRLIEILGPHYGFVGIDRASKVSQARALVELAKHLGSAPARHALIFPQGTISDIGKNSVERVQPGVFALSGRAGVPVLPVYIEQPNFYSPTRIVFGAPMPIPGSRQDCRAQWMEAVILLQNSLSPPARPPVLTEKHANNNRPGDSFF